MNTHPLSIPTVSRTGAGEQRKPALMRLSLWAHLPTFASAIHGGDPLHLIPERPVEGEQGAVSLEQVLWFVAAGLSVAVVAGILWTQIRTQATTPINVPSAP